MSNKLYALMNNTPASTCKGLFWRGYANSYVDSNHNIGIQKKLRFLKRISCKGCEYCYWLWEFIDEDIQILQEDYLPDIIPGKIYTYQINSSRDWESGIEEIDSITFKLANISNTAN